MTDPTTPQAAPRLSVDVPAHRVRIGDHPVDLSPLEFGLLAELARNVGDVVTTEQLLSRVWGYVPGMRTRTVHVHVSSLRRRLGPEAAQLIRNVRGSGYVLEAGSLAGLRDHEPVPEAERGPVLDLAQTLRDATENLDTYIEARAAKLAARHIAKAGAAAGEEVAAARAAQRRAEDLAAELRRQVTALEKQLGPARAGA